MYSEDIWRCCHMQWHHAAETLVEQKKAWGQRNGLWQESCCCKSQSEMTQRPPSARPWAKERSRPSGRPHTAVITSDASQVQKFVNAKPGSLAQRAVNFLFKRNAEKTNVKCSLFICIDVAVSEGLDFLQAYHSNAAAARLLRPPSCTLCCIWDTRQTRTMLIYIHMGGKID